MDVASAVIGRMFLSQLWNDGWKLKVKGHLVNKSGAEIIQPQPLDDRLMLARRPDGTEQEFENLRQALRFVNG